MQADKVHLDQVVHGYSRGHRELASSVALDAEARSRMLVFSDLLGSASLDSGDSYLTVYPLPSAARHVVARTWSAGPSLRPGSVWTHSILVHYSTLATFHDLTKLVLFLKNPSRRDLVEFESPIDLATSAGSVYSLPDTRAAQALMQIYASESSTIVIPGENVGRDEWLAVALWRQMWPALRREFSFIARTRVVVDFKSGLTLRFLDEFANPPRASTQQLDGISILERDLSEAGQTGLRSFLSNYANEAATPRLAAPMLASMYEALSGPDPIGALPSYTDVFNKEAYPRLRRDVLANILARDLTGANFCRLVKFFSGAGVELGVENVATAVASKDDETVLQVLEAIYEEGLANGIWGQQLFRRLLQRVTAEVLANFAKIAQAHIVVYSIRPEIASFRAFWPDEDADIARIIPELQPGISLTETVRVLGSKLGPKSFLELLRYATPYDEPTVAEFAVGLKGSAATEREACDWILASDLRMVRLLANEHGALLLERLVQRQIEGSPQSPSRSSWLTAIRAAQPPLSPGVSLMAYVVALRVRAEDGFLVAQSCVDCLLEHVVKGQLSPPEHKYLFSRLRRSSFDISDEDALLREIVDCWAYEIRPAWRLITISNNNRWIRSIANEIVSRFGAYKLEEGLVSSALNATQRRVCQEVAAEANQRKKSWWWW